MKFVVLVLCCVALAVAKPSPKGRGGDRKHPPLEARMVKLCLTLAEEALGSADKRSWDDVFGMLAPVCAEILEDLEDKEGVSGKTDGGNAGGDMNRRRFRKGSGDNDGSRDGKNRGDKTNDHDENDNMKSGKTGPRPSGQPPLKTGPRPSGQPPLRNILKDWFKDRSMGVDDDTNDDDSPNGDRSGKGSKGSNGRKSGKGSLPTPSDAPPQQNVVRSWFEARQDNGEQEGEQKEFDKVKALLGICEELVKLAEEKEDAGENGRSVEEGIEAMEAICDAAFEQAELDALE